MNNKQRILLIEDDFMIKEVYRTALENAGFLVDTSMNGEEGLEKVSSLIPDLILLDIFLPKMSGFEVLEKLKEDPVLSRIPVVVLTNIYIDREDLLKKGVEQCFIKAEITPDVLVEKVNQILNKKN